jgi:hypothetical protein
MSMRSKGEIIGKLREKFLSSVFSGLRAFEGRGRVDILAAATRYPTLFAMVPRKGWGNDDTDGGLRLAARNRVLEHQADRQPRRNQLLVNFRVSGRARKR